MAPHGRSPSSTRTGAGNKRCPLGSPRARPSSAPCPREARGSVCPPCGEDAARRERPDSPAPAYELHDLTERLITVGRAEHRARVFASAEEDELLRGAGSGKAPQDVRRGPERVASAGTPRATKSGATSRQPEASQFCPCTRIATRAAGSRPYRSPWIVSPSLETLTRSCGGTLVAVVITAPGRATVFRR